MGRTRRTIIGLLALAALTAAGCSAADDDADESADAPAEQSADDGAFEEFEAPADVAEADAAAPGDARTGGLGTSGAPVDAFGRDLITEVGLTMATNDVARTADDVRRLATANGGAVFSSDVTVGQPLEDGSIPGGGRMVVRIPPQDLDRLLADLDGLGGITRVTQESEDVTDQLVDLEIRIRQARAGIATIEEILARTTELDDLFAVETELSRRQVELERLLAAQRSTEDRVALATLTIQIEFRADVEEIVVPEPGEDGIGDAFRSGWDAFLGALFAIGYVLAVLAPFLATAMILGGIVWLVARRLRRHTDAVPTRGADRVDDEVSDRVDEPTPTA